MHWENICYKKDIYLNQVIYQIFNRPLQLRNKESFYILNS